MAADLELVVGSSEEGESAVWTVCSQIAGSIASTDLRKVDEPLSREIRPVEVPGADRSTGDQDLARESKRHQISVSIGQMHGRSGNGSSDGDRTRDIALARLVYRTPDR